MGQAHVGHFFIPISTQRVYVLGEGRGTEFRETLRSSISVEWQRIEKDRDSFTGGLEPVIMETAATPESIPPNLKNWTSSRSTSLAKKSLTVAKPHPYIARSAAHSQRGTCLNLKQSRCYQRHGASRLSGCGRPADEGNLFLEGFTDCASEVMRFLREVECVDDSNPLVQGLQSHLAKVRHTVCPENVADLKTVRVDLQGPWSPHCHRPSGVSESQNPACSPGRNQQTVGRVPELHPDTAVPETFLSSTQLSPQVPETLLSSTQPSSQVDRSSIFFTESEPLDGSSEISFSPSTNHHQSHSQSPQDECTHLLSSRSSTETSSSHTNLTSLPSSIDLEPVCSSDTSNISKNSPASFTSQSNDVTNTNTSGCKGYISYVTQLPNTDVSQKFTSCPSSSLNTQSLGKPIFVSSPSQTEALPQDSTCLSLVPLLAASQSASPQHDAVIKPAALATNLSQLEQRHTLSITPSTSLDSSVEGISPENCGTAISNFFQKSIPHGIHSTDILAKNDPVVAWCLQPPALSASSLSLLSTQQLHLPNTNLATVPACQNDLRPQSDLSARLLASTDNLSAELLQQASSVLELRPNFLPGVASSSVASGNFADVLLAVESCRGHSDSRVRALAEELIYLIHNDEDDMSDEEGEDLDASGDTQSDDEGRGEESGIEMDDSWSNPADLIEQ
ncbi:hypothetical protein ElyMa_006437800 [Elysia marginata]|uniref:Orange domain-containing protein n=1 Tax=Elysia marginata TaxID=1093978 RepID=A0AAV4HX05_9GAST|nr:hypothetical protein ElyMa_006437800 [Elysia marginata]